jgi:hypothetical protein
MYSRRFTALSALAIVFGFVAVDAVGQESDRKVTRYARFQVGETVATGLSKASTSANFRGTCSANGNGPNEPTHCRQSNS